MSDNSQDKKDTVPDVPSAKSYSTDGGATVEFDPGALHVHAISPELRQQMSGSELPRLDPQYLLDTAAPNRNGGATTATDQAAATTQPSLRRLQMVPPVPTGRHRGLPVFLALLVFAIAWEVVVLVRTRTSVEISGALPRTAETIAPAAGQNPEPAPEPVRAAELLAAPSPPAQPESSGPPATPAAERAPAARNSSPVASPPRAPAWVQDVEPPLHQETNVPPKPEGGVAPQSASSAKSRSKVLFPPQ